MHLRLPSRTEAQSSIPPYVQLEAHRHELIAASNELRLNPGMVSERTIRRLSRQASALIKLDEESLEVVFTLAETHANLLASGAPQEMLESITGLSQQALENHFPAPDESPESKRNLFQAGIYREAIAITTPNVCFGQALEEAYTAQGENIEKVISATEGKLFEMHRKNGNIPHLNQKANEITGEISDFDPFADD